MGKSTREIDMDNIEAERPFLSAVHSNDLLCCPYCNGKRGVEGMRYERFNVVWEWNGQSQAEPMGVAYQSRFGKCTDCGKRVVVPKAR